jgi:hypothetical protein
LLAVEEDIFKEVKKEEKKNNNKIKIDVPMFYIKLSSLSSVDERTIIYLFVNNW